MWKVWSRGSFVYVVFSFFMKNDTRVEVPRLFGYIKIKKNVESQLTLRNILRRRKNKALKWIMNEESSLLGIFSFFFLFDFWNFLVSLFQDFNFLLPSFRTAMPQHDPKIVGVERNYYEGDFLFGNCTSDYSSPPPNLAWYINDQKAEPHLLQPFQESTIEAYGFKLLQRSLEIRFRIDKKVNPFITDGKVHMRCVAQIRHMPSQLRESNHMFFISSLENQKLINWSSGKINCLDLFTTNL